MAAATVNTAVVALLAVAAASCLFAADPPLRREAAEDHATAVAEAVDAATVETRPRMAGLDGERETEEEDPEAGARRSGVTGDPARWIPEEAEGKRLRPGWAEKMQSDGSDSESEDGSDSESDSDSDSDSDSQSDSDFESDSDSGSDSDDDGGEKGKKVNAAAPEKEERRPVPRA